MHAALRRRAAVTLLVWAVAFELLATAYALPSGPAARLAVDDATPFVGQAVEFDASASAGHDEGNGRIVAYRFDFGDGTGTGWRETPSVSHAYAQLGALTASVTVRDGRGYEDQASVSVNVRFRPPAGPAPDLVPIQMRFSPAEPQAGDNVTAAVVLLNIGNATAASATVRIVDILPDGNRRWVGNFSLPAVAMPLGVVAVESAPWTATFAGNHTVQALIVDVSPTEASILNNELQAGLRVLPAGTPRDHGAGPPFIVDPLVLGLAGAGIAAAAGAAFFLLRPRPPGPMEPPPPTPPDQSPPPIWPP